MGNFSEHYRSTQFPLRPERILRELRKALPEDGYVVTDVGWNKNGVAQQFPFKVPGTFITPSGLATMGFGPAAVLGVKYAKPDRAAVALTGDGGFGANTSVIATAMEAKIPAVWVVMDNSAFGTIAGPGEAKYDWSFGCLFLRDGKPYSVDYAAIARAHGAQWHQHSRPPTSWLRRWRWHFGPILPTVIQCADGECADAHSRALEHQRYLPQGRVSWSASRADAGRV